VYGYYPGLLLTDITASNPVSLTALVDNFDDNTIDTVKWPGNYGTVSETGGRARISCDTSYNAYVSAATYSFDSMLCRAYPAAAAGASSNAYLSILVYSTGQAAGTDIGFTIDTVPGTLSLLNWSGYYDPSAVTLTYDPTNHAWLRLAISGPNVIWQTSPDGSTWTTQRTLATPAWLSAATDCRLYFEAHRDSGTTNYSEIDNVNVVPAIPAGLTVSAATGAPSSGIPTSAPTAIAISATAGTPATALNLTASPTGLAAPAATGSATTALNLAVAPTGLTIAPAVGAASAGIAGAAPNGLAVPVNLGQPSGPGLAIIPNGAAVPAIAGTPSAGLNLSASPNGRPISPTVGSPASSIPATAPTGLAIPVNPGQPAGPGLVIVPSGLSIAAAMGVPTATFSLSIAPTGAAVPVAVGAAATALSAPVPNGRGIPAGLGTPAVGALSAAPTGLTITVGLGQPSPVLPPQTSTPNAALVSVSRSKRLTTVTRNQRLTT
jgi:hypothetical protein